METAVLLHLPDTEALVGPWRAKADPAASLGLPPSVTLLYPFLPAERADVGVVAELAWFFAHVDAFDVVFAHVRELARDGVLYLDPLGPELDELAGALARRWPETPPYGGAVDRPHAHLTVAHTGDAGLRARACAEVQARLPLRTRARTASLWASDADGRWRQVEQFPLAERD